MLCFQFAIFFFGKFLEKVIYSSLLCFNEGIAEEDHVDVFVKSLLVNTFIWLFYKKKHFEFLRKICVKFSNYDFVLEK